LKSLAAAMGASLAGAEPVTSGAFPMQISSAANALAMLGASKSQQASGAANFFAPAEETQSQARKDFAEITNKSPAEQMRDQILKSLGLDEDKVKAMDPKAREALEAKIKEIIKTKIEQAQEQHGQGEPGQIVDVKA
jgi:hypothetical protein